MARRYTYRRGSRVARLHVRLASRLYALGVASGDTWGLQGDTQTVQVHWRGKRPYILGWPRPKWRCLLRYRHWPTSHMIFAGFCGKCCPWPCCGAITLDHADGCDGES